MLGTSQIKQRESDIENQAFSERRQEEMCEPVLYTVGFCRFEAPGPLMKGFCGAYR